VVESKDVRQFEKLGFWISQGYLQVDLFSVHSTVSVKFVVGSLGCNSTCRRNIDRENEMFQDIAILEDCEDTYATLTKKLLAGFEFFANQFPDAQYLLKVIYLANH
jgi:hypothetical protein